MSRRHVRCLRHVLSTVQYHVPPYFYHFESAWYVCTLEKPVLILQPVSCTQFMQGFTADTVIVNIRRRPSELGEK